MLELVVEGDRHQEVLSAGLRLLARFLEDNRLVFRAQLGDASPSWVPDWVDDRVFDRVFVGLQGFLEEVGADPATSCGAPTTRGCAPTCTRCAPTRAPRRRSRT